MDWHIFDQTFQLLPQKALFWAAQNTLILADLHLGKTAHFRKEGLAIPQASSQADYNNLQQLMLQYQPARLLILGDLFHSYHNLEWQQLAQFLEKHPKLELDLVGGNHDILDTKYYNQLGINLLGSVLTLGNLLFTHQPAEAIAEGYFNICGHIHPGVRLEAKARQSVGLPCFFQKKNQLILPAFGHLTGLHYLNPKEASAIFAVHFGKVSKLR
jgi:uncharacterized protein